MATILEYTVATLSGVVKELIHGIKIVSDYTNTPNCPNPSSLLVFKYACTDRRVILNGITFRQESVPHLYKPCTTDTCTLNLILDSPSPRLNEYKIHLSLSSLAEDEPIGLITLEGNPEAITSEYEKDYAKILSLLVPVFETLGVTAKPSLKYLIDQLDALENDSIGSLVLDARVTDVTDVSITSITGADRIYRRR